MKPVRVAALVFLMTGGSFLSAQVAIGARHGFGLGASYLEKDAGRAGAVNGVHVIVPVSSLYLQAEASMIPEVVDVAGGFDKTSLSSVELPVLARVPLALSGPEWLRLTLTVGPRFVFRFNGSDGSENLQWEDLHKLDVGLSLGVELGAVIGFYTVFLDIRGAGGVLPVARGYRARSALASAALGYRVTLQPRLKKEPEDDQPAPEPAS